MKTANTKPTVLLSAIDRPITRQEKQPEVFQDTPASLPTLSSAPVPNTGMPTSITDTGMAVGPMPGSADDLALGPTSGPTAVSTIVPASNTVICPVSGPAVGPTCGPTVGPTRDPVSGLLSPGSRGEGNQNPEALRPLPESFVTPPGSSSGLQDAGLRELVQREISHCLLSMMSNAPPPKQRSRMIDLSDGVGEPCIPSSENGLNLSVPDEMRGVQRGLFVSPEPPEGRTQAVIPNFNNVRRRPRTRGPNHQDSTLESLRAELRDMRSRVHTATTSAPDIHRMLCDARNTPFTRRISQVHIPSSGKVKLPMYAGCTDPSHHLTAFSIAMGRYHFSDAEYDPGHCQLFVETLEGPALTWFSRLETHSIDSFHELSTVFLTHYSMYVQQHVSDADLWTTVQGPDEPLREYLNKFRTVASQVNVSNTTALAALRHGLWIESKFRDDITINKPQSLEDALHRGATFASMEEEHKAISARFTHLGYRPQPSGQPNQPKPSVSAPPPSHSSRQGSSRSASYAVSSGSRAPNTWVRPGSAYDGTGSDGDDEPPKRFCEYHKTASHNTSDCRQLREYLFSLLQNGTLPIPEKPPRQPRQTSKVTKDGGDRSQRAESPPFARAEPAQPASVALGKRPATEDCPPPQPPRRNLRVDMIMGGLHGCDDSVRSIQMAQQRAATPEARLPIPEFEEFSDKVSFSEADAAGLNFPHNDPLVIELTVVDRDVSRILVDTGSTVDVIYCSTLERMGIPRLSIRPRPQSLTGFNGTVENTLGYIKLAVTIGRMAWVVRFLVVDRVGPYNAIVGTPFLSQLKAVASPYHQCLKFPTPYGIYTLRGNQQIARSCFVTERRLRNTTNMCHEIRTPTALGSSFAEPLN